MKYAVRLDPRTWKGIERLPDDIRGRIVRRLKSLEEDPRPPGVAKLSGAEDLYRVRAGDWRIVYAVRDRELVVVVIRIGHRREVYR
ncbi:MAG: type II toxin-antitoxin system RelE/ParE family toxin [Lentisphaerae bacterium]|nr:type II toxin-antitoxin system RelE/ParE family toxin [Kiritimatiellia bacterium]MDD2462352.1 type II toxin-antitoxin system RelE/ParE family toxin [Kiritimatiellia bacterium]MDD4172947.1 type II toxin-antitoxin system RelE/ParE family toxin [Kiritimatiellia bacterium]MDD4443252.1 type II toxin-antitoxin system RelE/ParE family toxin [Kiritimatiellia bacterium]NLC81168.1 type II toxin-antitoxin system RelE/ParE family toxin [Lentisphaerota bacterium]